MLILEKRIAKKKTNIRRGNLSIKNTSESAIRYEWMEKLLQTPIEDGRRYVLWKILCPYLVDVKKL